MIFTLPGGFGPDLQFVTFYGSDCHNICFEAVDWLPKGREYDYDVFDGIHVAYVREITSETVRRTICAIFGLKPEEIVIQETGKDRGW